MLSSVQIFAAGQTGQEAFNLLIDDQVVETFERVGGDIESRDFERFAFDTDGAVTADQVSIEFINDAFDPETGVDSNLVVDRIEIDGAVFQTEAPTTFSTGIVDENGFTGPGFLETELLNVNGTVSFLETTTASPPVQTDVGTRIRVDAKGETGEEILQLQIDGQPVQDFTFTAAGEEQILLFETDAVIDSSQVSFVFLNDAFDPVTGFDRNVDVSQFQVIDLGSDTREIFNIATAEGALTQTGDFLNVANSGTVASSPSVQPPPVQAAPGTQISVAATGQTGEEILQLQIDGQPVQDFTFSAAGREQTFFFETDGPVDASQVSFVFINDFFDPATGFDRNVAVSQFQVVDLATDSTETFNFDAPNSFLLTTGASLNASNAEAVSV